MPAATRIATVEFRSLLLPPVSIPVRALQALARPQCAVPTRCAPQCLTQRRAINLYKTARAQTTLGQHKSLIFSPYTLEPLSASEHRINLFEADKHHANHKLIAKNVSFQEVHDKYIKAGHMLYSMQALKKNMAKEMMNDNNPELLNPYKDYSFVHARTHQISKKTTPQKGRQLGGIKNIIFNESSPVAFYRICMDRAYQFIEAGSPVEFRIRLQGSKLSKEARLQPGDPTIWPWMHARFPHLRPDIIRKGMPEGTEFLINPVTDGRVMQWVLAKATQESNRNLDARFQRIQKMVTESIKSGRQEMLPQLMRQQLAESGNPDYSPHTGLPRKKAKVKYGRGGKRVKFGAEERKHMAKDAEAARFLVPDPNRAPKDEDEAEDEDETHKSRTPQRTHRWMGRGSKRT